MADDIWRASAQTTATELLLARLDSDPDSEFEETLHKARALHHALELAAGLRGQEASP